jgi:hypothetical protein
MLLSLRLCRAPDADSGRGAVGPLADRHEREDSGSEAEEEELQPTQAAKRQRTAPSQAGRAQRMGSQLNTRTFPAVSSGSYLTCVAHLGTKSVQCSRKYLKSSAQQDLTAAIGVVRHESDSGTVLLVQMVPGGAVGIAGQIKLVHAEYFMCHRNFDVEFG